MPAVTPVVAPSRRRRARTADVFTPPSPPTTCPGSYNWNPTQVNLDASVRPVAPRPANRESSYTFPTSPCGTGTGGCAYCRTDTMCIQELLDATPIWANILYETELAMGRRLTYQQAISLYEYISNHGSQTTIATCGPPETRLAFIAARTLEYQRQQWGRNRGAVARQEAANKEKARLARGKDKEIQLANQAKRLASLEKALTQEPEASADMSPASLLPVRPMLPRIFDSGGFALCGHRNFSTSTTTGMRTPLPETDLCWCHDPTHPGNMNNRRNRDGLPVSPHHGIPFVTDKRDMSQNLRMVGVEVEFNGLPNLTRWANRWHGAVHRDGSCGYEAVTTPIAGKHIDSCLVELCKTIRDQGVQANNACGVHVHVDANDMTWDCMKRLIIVYAKVEPLLYLIAGQQRMQGQYCKPCGKEYTDALKQKDWKDAVLGVALASKRNGSTGKALAKLQPKKKSGDRYRGLNIMPWVAGRRLSAPDTTVEFRMHRNSLDGKRIAGWAHLLAAMVTWAASASDKEVKNLPRSALRTLVQVIAPNERAWVMSRIKAWREACTAEKSGKSNAEGSEMVQRRISFQKGVWACVV